MTFPCSLVVAHRDMSFKTLHLNRCSAPAMRLLFCRGVASACSFFGPGAVVKLASEELAAAKSKSAPAHVQFCVIEG